MKTISTFQVLNLVSSVFTAITTVVPFGLLLAGHPMSIPAFFALLVATIISHALVISQIEIDVKKGK